jgi:hypothetical protein
MPTKSSELSAGRLAGCGQSLLPLSYPDCGLEISCVVASVVVELGA